MPVVSRALPSAYTDNTGVGVPNRGGTYGEQYVQVMTPTKHPISDEGSYFVATNPTPGTAVTFAVNASYDVTKSLYIIYNGDGVGGKNVYVDSITTIVTAAPASATQANYALWLDKQNAYSSGGTAITPVNVNGNSSRTSVSTVYIPATAVLTTAALTSNKRLVGRGVLRSVIPAVGDEINVQFGGDSADAGGSSSTAAGRTATSAPPVIIPPGWSLAFNVWFPSNSITPAQFEVAIGLYER